MVGRHIEAEMKRSYADEHRGITQLMEDIHHLRFGIRADIRIDKSVPEFRSPDV
jgi:hypothetical protein